MLLILITLLAFAQNSSEQLNYQRNRSDNYGGIDLPNVFRQVDLIRNIIVDKVYARERINVVIENIAQEEQHYYYLPLESDIESRVGGLEIGDKNHPDNGFFEFDMIENSNVYVLIGILHLCEGHTDLASVQLTIAKSIFLIHFNRKSSKLCISPFMSYLR